MLILFSKNIVDKARSYKKWYQNQLGPGHVLLSKTCRARQDLATMWYQKHRRLDLVLISNFVKVGFKPVDMHETPGVMIEKQYCRYQFLYRSVFNCIFCRCFAPLDLITGALFAVIFFCRRSWYLFFYRHFSYLMVKVETEDVNSPGENKTG